MTSDDSEDQQVDDKEQTRLIACDALLRAASTERETAFSGAPSPEDRGRDRLRLLLRMLEASETDDDPGPVADRISRSQGRDDDRPLLGRFEVLDHLGSGGFGFVVRARDRLLDREVALKVPLPERVLSPRDVHRFLREARSAARLDHPNIVRVHDAGELGPLGYFIASEFCEGPSLRRWLNSQNQPVPVRLAALWVAAIADAVQHAHDRGILHRDIKPDNILLTGGANPEVLVPRLTDFGLAKLVAEAGDETRSEARLGTAQYMAPEQAAGRRGEVGPAADVYGLGATLYEILTGRPPFRGETDVETLRLVIESDPVTPRSLRPGLPRDLDTICLKCLRKVPAQRYESAAALHDDLERFLDGRPIVGRPVSAWERSCGWARRRPAVAALLGLVILLLCGLVGGIAAWASWLEWHNNQLEIQIARGDQKAREAEKQTRIAEERRHQADRHHYAESLRRARRALDARQIELAQDILHDIQPEAGGHDHRDFAWRHLWRQAHREFSQLWGHEATVVRGSLARDGRTLATLDLQGKALLWDLSPDMELDRPRGLPAPPDATWDDLWLSPDGRLLAALGRGVPNRRIDFFELASSRHMARLNCKPGEEFLRLCFDARGRRAAVARTYARGGQSVNAWDISARSARLIRKILESDSPFFQGFSADGSLLAVHQGEQFRLLDPWTGQARVTLAVPQPGRVSESTFSPDGRYFAAPVPGNGISVWETADGRETARFQTSGEAVQIAIGTTGSYAAVMDSSGRVTILDRTSRQERLLMQGYADRAIVSHSLAFSPDESRLAIGIATDPGGPQPVEVWDVASARRLHVFPARNHIETLAFLPDGRTLILAGGTTPRIWRLEAPKDPVALAGHNDEAWAAAFSPDGKVLATGSDDTDECQTIKLWDPDSGRLRSAWKGHSATVAALAFSPDGRILASASLSPDERGSDNVILWDAASHRRMGSLKGHTNRVRSVAFSPDGRWLATASDDMTARLWDVAKRTTRAILSGHTKNLIGLAFSPDGRWLASSSNDATVRLWDVATGIGLAILPDVNNVNAVAFAPDGSLLASANEDGEIKLWDPATAKLVRSIHGEADQLRCLRFSPDGRNVVAAGKGKVIRIWDVATGQELLTLEGHEAQINALAFSPDGSTLASCGHDGAVKLWRAGPIQMVPTP